MYKGLAKFVSLVLCFALVFGAPVFNSTAYADDDSTPPVLVSMAANKANVATDGTVTITMVATDNESGINPSRSQFEVYLYHSADSAEYLGTYHFQPVEGQPDTYSATIYFDENNKSGDYRLNYVWVFDNAGNQVYGTLPDLGLPQVTFHYTNTVAEPESIPPVITGASISTHTASPGDTVTITINVHDSSPINADRSYVQIAPVNNRFGYTSDCYPLVPVADHPDQLQATFRIPDNIANGAYYLDSVWVYDKWNNYTWRVKNSSQWQTLLNAVTLSVNNPAVQPTGYIKIVDCAIVPREARRGDLVTIRVKLDPHGHMLLDNLHAAMLGLNTGETKLSSTAFTMARKDGNWYEGTMRLSGYAPDYYRINESEFQLYNEGEAYPPARVSIINEVPEQTASFTTRSMFDGVANTTVLVGSEAFDAMAGVSASNNVQGDLTGRIEVTGSVDTSTIGVYLLKYKIPLTEDEWLEFNDGAMPHYFETYRWVGVSEVLPDPTTVPDTTVLAVTDDSLSVGADAADVNIALNGHSIAYSEDLNAAGKYSFSVKDPDAPSARTLAAGTAKSGGTASAVIDKSGPTIIGLNVVSKTSAGYTLKVSAKDDSGVSLTKYKLGTCSLDTMKSGGTTAAGGTFVLPTLATCTVYARDCLGHESVKTFTPKFVRSTSVRISRTSMKLNSGTKYRLTATVYPTNASNRTVTWRSSNPSVASVDSRGNVRALAGGSAVITASAADGSGRKATCKVTVKQLVSKVSLNLTQATVTRTRTLKLSAQVSPGTASIKKLKWTSSNTRIAIVSSAGVVTAKAAGVVIITAAATDGSGRKATCRVTVVPIAATGVRLSKTAVSLLVSKTITLTATVLPANADNKAVTWASNDTTVATVDRYGRVRALKKGTAEITAKTTNGLTAKCVVTVS